MIGKKPEMPAAATEAAASSSLESPPGPLPSSAEEWWTEIATALSAARVADDASRRALPHHPIPQLLTLGLVTLQQFRELELPDDQGRRLTQKILLLDKQCVPLRRKGTPLDLATVPFARFYMKLHEQLGLLGRSEFDQTWSEVVDQQDQAPAMIAELVEAMTPKPKKRAAKKKATSRRRASGGSATASP